MALLADLYHLTMAYGFWQQGIHECPAVFQLYFRRAPFGGDWALAAGLELALAHLEKLAFTVEDIQYLGRLQGHQGQPLFPLPFLNYLQRLRFPLTVEAIPEGTIVFPNQPLLRVSGPLLAAQLVESALLNLVNFSTLIATKAARICQAAGEDPVIEFGLRRAQGIDGGLTAARAAYLGGCQATSNLLAGQILGIPVRGTHAHSWVMAFPSEIEAFTALAEALPQQAAFLVDTYDTLAGVDHAITVGQELRERGYPLQSIRLDSGDLAALSRAARQRLDAAGFTTTKIIASDQLDEQRIAALKAAGAPIDVWGVGTQLVTGGEHSALGGVYKLAAIQDPDGTWRFPYKKSADPAKRTLPGIHQVWRFFAAAGNPQADVLAPQGQSLPPQRFRPVNQNELSEIPMHWQGLPLLQTVWANGQRVQPAPSLDTLRAYGQNQRASFSNRLNPYLYGIDPALLYPNEA